MYWNWEIIFTFQTLLCKNILLEEGWDNYRQYTSILLILNINTGFSGLKMGSVENEDVEL